MKPSLERLYERAWDALSGILGLWNKTNLAQFDMLSRAGLHTWGRVVSRGRDVPCLECEKAPTCANVGHSAHTEGCGAEG